MDYHTHSEPNGKRRLYKINNKTLLTEVRLIKERWMELWKYGYYNILKKVKQMSRIFKK